MTGGFNFVFSWGNVKLKYMIIDTVLDWVVIICKTLDFNIEFTFERTFNTRVLEC